MYDQYQRGALVLADGSRYEGWSFGARTSTPGEVVFNTGMVGYPESLSDPSYRGQLLTLTFPLVGNYGVPVDEADEQGLSRHFESDRLQIAGLIVANYSDEPHHWRRHHTLGQWLVDSGVPALFGLDTRALTKKIRESGAMLGAIVCDDGPTPAFSDPNARNLVESPIRGVSPIRARSSAG